MEIDEVIKNLLYQPRFHVGSYTSDFQSSLKPILASWRVATKTFHVYQTLMNNRKKTPKKNDLLDAIACTGCARKIERLCPDDRENFARFGNQSHCRIC